MTSTRSKKAPASLRTEPSRGEPPTAIWNPATRVLFRFTVVYLTLFCLVTQISGSMLPNVSFYYRGLGRLWPLRDITLWTAQTVFGVLPGPDEVTSDGEPLFFWVQLFWVAIVSACGTVIWSIVDRHQRQYTVMHAWFRLFVRFALGAALLEYGMTKVIPTQFPPPSLATLVTPVGDLTLSALLWTSIGASPAYEVFTGCVESLAGLLLLIPRTTLLGALVGLGTLMQVFALNMTYDVGLKVVSLHLMLLAAVLLAPDMPRLIDLFIRNRGTLPRTEPPLPRTARGKRIAMALQLVAALYLVGMYLYINVEFWQIGGGGRPNSTLYGIWNVEQLAVDGQIRPAELNDYDRRWRRFIFDEPGIVRIQRTDDSFARYGASLPPGGESVTLSKGTSRTWSARFRVAREGDDRLVLEGDMDGYRVQVQLRQVGFDTYRLLNSPFRWVRPHESRAKRNLQP